MKHSSPCEMGNIAIHLLHRFSQRTWESNSSCFCYSGLPQHLRLSLKNPSPLTVDLPEQINPTPFARAGILRRSVHYSGTGRTLKSVFLTTGSGVYGSPSRVWVSVGIRVYVDNWKLLEKAACRERRGLCWKTIQCPNHISKQNCQVQQPAATTTSANSNSRPGAVENSPSSPITPLLPFRDPYSKVLLSRNNPRQPGSRLLIFCRQWHRPCLFSEVSRQTAPESS
jgi:hypothetical protein